jgi:hypothetical protein
MEYIKFKIQFKQEVYVLKMRYKETKKKKKREGAMERREGESFLVESLGT